MVERLFEKVMDGESITYDEAIELYNGAELETLTRCANDIRKRYRGDSFDICTIVNAKCGKCSENCKFCAQSVHNHTGIEDYPLISTDELVEGARVNDEQGVLRYSIVTSGRRLSDRDVERICESVRAIREKTGIRVCASFGLLDVPQYQRLKDAGVTRIHNNLETSRRFFPYICTTHTFDDKIRAIRAAQSVGLEVCSGGIMGLGETGEDRVDMAFTLRELGIRSVPVNVLNPIKGTPLEDNRRLMTDEVRRIVAVYRFILPYADIRLAGGRGPMPDKGRSLFLSGSNAAISGDMLTTQGITVETDMRMLGELGYEVKCDE